jgi:hypothetical protein
LSLGVFVGVVIAPIPIQNNTLHQLSIISSSISRNKIYIYFGERETLLLLPETSNLTRELRYYSPIHLIVVLCVEMHNLNKTELFQEVSECEREREKMNGKCLPVAPTKSHLVHFLIL